MKEKLQKIYKMLAKEAAKSRSRMIGTIQNLATRAQDEERPIVYLETRAEGADSERTREAATRILRALEAM